MATTQSAKAKGKQRDPPPALFIQPSPAASHVSLPGVLASGAPAIGSSSTVPTQPPRGSSHLRQEVGSAALPPGDRRQATLHPLGIGPLGAGFPPPQLRQESTRATDRTDALWAEMQATLEEVELSASGGTRVFGPDHDHKLTELRQAQIALAQAWARSEADEAIETSLSEAHGDVRNLKVAVNAAKDAGGESGGKTEGGTIGGPGPRPGSSGLGAERLGVKMEEETEVDILLARKRREANDKYFQRVNQGVLDVVAKLEDVAIAMRAVEQESKDVWEDGESVPSTAKSVEES